MVQLTCVVDTDGNTDLVEKGFPENECDNDGRLEGTTKLEDMDEVLEGPEDMDGVLEGTRDSCAGIPV